MTFGTPVTCDSTVTVSGALTAGSLAGGAVTQVQNLIDAAMSKARFSAYAAAASAGFTTGTVKVPFDTVVYSTGSSDFGMTSNVITVKRAMLAMVSYNASIDMTVSNTRTAGRFDLKQTALGGGSYSIVRGATAYTYHRQTSVGEGSASVSLIVAFAVNDELFLDAGKAAPSTATVKTIADACSISIIEL